MKYQLKTLSDLDHLPFDALIDARSPAEFSEDHIPGAINLPVMDNEQRAHIGTLYVQDSKFKARKIGAALVARTVATHLETTLAAKPNTWKPLIYCWRGGQRSGAFATILAQIGWRAHTLDGGYQSYRRHVKACLYDTPFPCPVILLDGNTGSAKTEILLRLKQHGMQVIDLEELAHHRGSLFGARQGGQPSQKAFETALACETAKLDPARPLIVEAESSKIGARILPPALWRAMKAAPRLEIQAPLAARARYLTRAYADIIKDTERLSAAIDKLTPYQPRARIARWHELVKAGDMHTLAAELMHHHYDTRYERSRAGTNKIIPFSVPGLDSPNLDKLAEQIKDQLMQMSAPASW